MKVILKPGREKSLLRRHPWIFSGAIQEADTEIPPGATVDVLAANKQFLGRAAYSPESQIRARMWTFADEPINADFFRRKIQAAIQARRHLPEFQAAEAIRLVYAESDGIPGLIVDQYADVLVMQCLTTGAEIWKDTLAKLLLDETGCASLYERSDADVRTLEGLQPSAGPLLGTDVPTDLVISEHGLTFNVDVSSGHKTGFYLDQRANRLRVRELAREKDVLDCFCYTGGFSANALVGGAKSVVAVDSSADALRSAQENLTRNDLPLEQVKLMEADVFQQLRRFRDEGRMFDMIILDPPKFAPTSAQAERASRGYKDINLLAFKLLRPGGLLVTFSCSGGISADLFQKIVAGAALDAGVDAQILEHLSQNTDHPVSLSFPEGAYLKGLVCLKK